MTKKKLLTQKPDDSEEDFEIGLDRDEELSTKKAIEETLIDVYDDIERGFKAQMERADEIADYWDIYNNILNQHQFYNGTSRLFVPIVHNAVNARKTRFTNQLFPTTGRYVEVTTEDGTLPQAEMALLEHYVRMAKMRTQVAPPLIRNGDVEGQYTIYIDWQETTRHVVTKKKKPIPIPLGGFGAPPGAGGPPSAGGPLGGGGPPGGGGPLAGGLGGPPGGDQLEGLDGALANVLGGGRTVGPGAGGPAPGGSGGSPAMLEGGLPGAEHMAEASDAPGEPDTVADEEGLEIDIGEETYDVDEQTLTSGRPRIEVIADTDFLVLPFTADSLDEAIDNGGSVTIIRRWTPAQIRRMMKRGLVREDEGESLLAEMKKEEKPGEYDKAKKAVDAAGIHFDQRGGKFAQVYETWLKIYLKHKDGHGERRLCRVYFAGEKRILGCKRNPYWSDRLPIKSAPVEKIQGSFKGVPKLQAVADTAYQANDAINEGMDSAAYALAPIIMSDPERNPRVASMVLSMAAVWLCDPKSTEFAKFPPLYKDALEIVGYCLSSIFQTLGVNPAQITQVAANPRKKPSQAEIANEQQIDILTTADAVTVLEEEIFTPALAFMLELDHQFRDDDLIVRQYGEMGARASMQAIPPTQMDRRYQFRWFGVEAARNAQQIQQQISGLNILRSMPPQLYQGYRLDLAPAIAQLVENTFGPRLAPLIFKDARQELTMDPMEENKLLAQGLMMPVHLMDNHQQHLMAHMQQLQAMGDASGVLRTHMMAHAKAMEQQQMQAMQQLGPPGAQGAPGGPPGPGGPGGAGRRAPAPGAQPQVPRGGQKPPGAIHEDRMKDPAMMPTM